MPKPHRWFPGGRAVTSLAAALCLVVGGAVAPAAAEPDDAQTTLWAAFEAGTLSAWSATSNVILSPGYAASGAFGARAVSTASRGGYLSWDSDAVAQGERYARIRGWVKVAAASGSTDTGVMTVKNGSGRHHFDIFRDTSEGTWRWDLFRDDYALSTMTADIGRWYYIEALVDFGGVGGTTYRAQVRIDGIDQPTIVSTGEVGTTVRSAWFGEPQPGRTNTRLYDSLVLDVGNTPYSFTR